MSLSLRLWCVVLLAVSPIFAMVAFDYQAQRKERAQMLEEDVQRMLSVSAQQEALALESVRSTLQVMSRANDLQDLDLKACSALARRMLDSLEDYNNLGAALPDGMVFCSGRGTPGTTSVTDRAWFSRSIASEGITQGEFVRGRVSGRLSLVLGLPIREADGRLRAVAFASIGFRWFDRLLTGYGLPEGWEANLISRDGLVLAGTSFAKQGEKLTSRQLKVLNDISSRPGNIAEITDASGQVRLNGVRKVGFAEEDIFVAIGAPLGATLGEVDRAFYIKTLMLAVVTLISALLARLVIYRLIERWATRLTDAAEKIGMGRLDTRIDVASTVRELRALELGFNKMAEGLECREAEIESRDRMLRRLSMAVEQSPTSIAITDTRGRIEYVNDAFLRITGYTRDEIIGANPRILNNGATPRATYESLWSTLKAGEVWRGEFHNARKDGEPLIESATIAPIRDPNGVVTHYVAIKEDITLRRHAESLMHRLAYYDALTDLPNRAMLRDRLQHAMQVSRQSGQYGVLLLLDIDRFKQINDTRGQALGDELLRVTGRRLRGALDEADTVARQGDDDFGVIVEQLGEDKAKALIRAERIARKLHEALCEPYVLEGTSVLNYVTHSVGVTLFGGDFEDVAHPDAVFKQAEVALFTAKEAGRNAICFFSPQMQDMVDTHAAMEAGLRFALANSGFRLFFQPLVDENARLVGAEALIRWVNAEGKFISPAIFIPIAEEAGLISPIGQWVLETACAQLARWQDRPEMRAMSISVNISARQFYQPNFVDHVLGCLARHHVHPGLLKIEITESVILSDQTETVMRMAKLKSHGVKFSLDDFGTGYASLSYLKSMPFDQIKIDQSFVRDLTSLSSSEVIVKAILGLGASLGLEVVAEGVETPAQADFLRTHGCKVFQGYLYGRPMPIEDWPDVWPADGFGGH